jgi:hypothetical protein
VGSIFDDFQIIPSGNILDCIHLTDLPAKMFRNDGFDSPASMLVQVIIQSLGIEIKRILIDIDKDRIGAQVTNNLSRRGKGKWRSNDPITLPYSDCFQRQMQSSRSRIHSQSMFATQIRSELLFELLYLLSGGQPARFENFGHFLNFFIANRGQMKREKRELRWIHPR